MKYMEIRDLIEAELKNYSSNQMIPSERYLALKFECSRETVRKSYEQLRAEDKIYKRQNVGWFVRALLHKDLKCKAPLIDPNLRRNLGKWAT